MINKGLTECAMTCCIVRCAKMLSTVFKLNVKQQHQAGLTTIFYFCISKEFDLDKFSWQSYLS